MNHAIKNIGLLSEEFFPYQFRQVHIFEFPHTKLLLNLFPTPFLFSEAIGFIYDVSEDTDIDNAFHVTSHEVAHQWWGASGFVAPTVRVQL